MHESQKDTGFWYYNTKIAIAVSVIWIISFNEELLCSWYILTLLEFYSPRSDGGRNYSGGALTLHQLHSVWVCVSYVWQSLSDITEQLLAGHQSGSQWTHSYQAASAQLGYAQTHKVIKLMYKNKIGEN